MRARRSSRSASGTSIVNGRIVVSPADLSVMTAMWSSSWGRWCGEGTSLRCSSTCRACRAPGVCYRGLPTGSAPRVASRRDRATVKREAEGSGQRHRHTSRWRRPVPRPELAGPGSTTRRSPWENQALTPARSRTNERTLGSSSLAAHRSQRRKEASVFVELDSRRDAGYTVSLEWDRNPGETQIVVADSGASSPLVFPVLAESAGEAFRHPFGYAP